MIYIYFSKSCRRIHGTLKKQGKNCTRQGHIAFCIALQLQGDKGHSFAYERSAIIRRETTYFVEKRLRAGPCLSD